MKYLVATMIVLSSFVGKASEAFAQNRPHVISPYSNAGRAAPPRQTGHPTTPARPPQTRPPAPPQRSGGYNPGSGPVHIPRGSQHHGNYQHPRPPHSQPGRVIGPYNPGSGPIYLPPKPKQQAPRHPSQTRQPHVRYYPVYPPAIHIWTTPSEQGGNRGGNHGGGATPQTLSLSRGDVILTVNGQSIGGHDDCIRAVNNSPPTMVFTVRDSRDGTIWRMQTQLNSQGSRFGVYLADNPGGGAYVTSVMRNHPATRCHVLGRE